MSETLILAHDNVSIHSELSFSTACESSKLPPRQLRRRNTVTTLKRWASKRISRPPLHDDTHGNELSEKNLNSLDLETRFLDVQEASTSSSHKPGLEEPFQTRELVKGAKPFQELEADMASNHDLQNDRDPYILQKYDSFCHQFILSGASPTKRNFDLSMASDEVEHSTRDSEMRKSMTNNTGILSSHLAEESGSRFDYLEHQPNTMQTPSIRSEIPDTTTVQSINYPNTHNPSSPYHESTAEKNVDHLISSNNQPEPPSQIITPFVYMEMQRATREQKLARRKSLWQPLRSLFTTSEALHPQ